MRPFSEEGVSLGHRWVAAYNRHLFLVLALRRLAEAGGNRGSARAEITTAARELVELEDYLLAVGYRPTLGIAGEEARLMRATRELVLRQPWVSPHTEPSVEILSEDLARLHAAWASFERTVCDLAVEHLLTSPALETRAFRLDGVLRLLGPRRIAVPEYTGQVLGEVASEPFVRGGPDRAGANGHALATHPAG